VTADDPASDRLILARPTLVSALLTRPNLVHAAVAIAALAGGYPCLAEAGFWPPSSVDRGDRILIIAVMLTGVMSNAARGEPQLVGRLSAILLFGGRALSQVTAVPRLQRLSDANASERSGSLLWTTATSCRSNSFGLLLAA
jgi:hypothetical protein